MDKEINEKETQETCKSIVTQESPHLLNLSITEAIEFSKAAFISKAFANIQNQEQLLMKVLSGQELGIKPIESINSLYIVNGKIGMGVQLMGSLMKRQGYEYTYAYDNEDKPTSCEVVWSYHGKRLGTSRFTMNDAKRAGLIKAGGAWEKYPKDLLFARAFSSGARKYAPEALSSMGYTPEELQSIAPEKVTEAEFKEIPPEAPATPPAAIKVEPAPETPIKTQEATVAPCSDPQPASGVEPQPDNEEHTPKPLVEIYGDMLKCCWEHGNDWEEATFKGGKKAKVHKNADGKNCYFYNVIKPVSEKIIKEALGFMPFSQVMRDGKQINVTTPEFKKWLEEAKSPPWTQMPEYHQLAILASLMLQIKRKEKASVK